MNIPDKLSYEDLKLKIMQELVFDMDPLQMNQWMISHGWTFREMFLELNGVYPEDYQKPIAYFNR